MWSYPKCWEAQSWLLTTNTVSCFPFRNRLTLLTVEKMTAQYTQVRVPTFCQLLFQEKMVVHEKAASAACNSITQVPFFQAPIVLHSAAAECFLCTSHSVTKNIKMTWTQGSRFNKVVIPIARFLKGFLEGNWCALFFFFFFPFFIANVRWRRMQGLPGPLAATALISAKAPAVSPQLLLHHECKCQHSEKTNNVFVLF